MWKRHPDVVSGLILEGASSGIPTCEERDLRRESDEELAQLLIEDGIEAARLCVTNIIAAVKTGLEGDWRAFDRDVGLDGPFVYFDCLNHVSVGLVVWISSGVGV